MCDCLLALAGATRHGSSLFAKNSDRPPSEPQVIERHEPRRDRGPVRATHIEVAPWREDTIGFVGSRPTWMWGVEHGVNDAGLAVGNETIYTRLDPRPFRDALVGMDLVRLALERAVTAAAAVSVITDLLQRYGQGGTGHVGVHRPYWSSFLVADPTSGYVVETSGTAFAVEEVAVGGGAATRAISNRTTIPAFDEAHRHPRQPVAALVDPRLEASRSVLARGGVDVDGLKRHLRSHAGGDGGWTVCMHVEGIEATTAAIVAELPPAPARPVAHLLLGSPCRSIFVPVVVGQPLGPVPAWERFAALGPEHRDALDALEAELARDVTDDPAWNAHAWQRVSTLLPDTGAGRGRRRGDRSGHPG
jgi:hypothetical protein